MLHPSSLPTVALLVEPSETCDRGQIDQLARRLSAARIGATWVVARADQLERLADTQDDSRPTSWGLRSAAGDLSELAAELAQRGRPDRPIDVLACDIPAARSELPRLHALGIRSILCTQVAAGQAQRTAEGIWQFGESLSTRSFDRLFARSVTGRLDHHQAGLAIVRIDLAAMRTSRGCRRIERLVDWLAERQARQIGVVSLAEAAQTLEARTVPRPQRSILRAA